MIPKYLLLTHVFYFKTLIMMIFKVKRSLKIYQVNNGMLLNNLSLNHNKFNLVFYRHIVKDEFYQKNLHHRKLWEKPPFQNLLCLLYWIRWMFCFLIACIRDIILIIIRFHSESHLRLRWGE